MLSEYIRYFRVRYIMQVTPLQYSFNMDQSWPLSNVYFRPFLIPIAIKISTIHIEKSVDCVLGIWTQGRWMVGADKTMEQWQPTNATLIFAYGN